MKSLLLIILIIMPLGNLVADEHRNGQTSLHKIYGKCQKLVFKSDDMNCEDFIYQSQYENGTTGFWFFTKNEGLSALTFSGWIQDQILLKGSETKQPIRLLHSASGKVAKDKILAEGVCLYGNLFSGIAKIECKAVDYDMNIFRGVFITDGEPPKLEN